MQQEISNYLWDGWMDGWMDEILTLQHWQSCSVTLYNAEAKLGWSLVDLGILTPKRC